MCGRDKITMEGCLDKMELCRGKCPQWTVARKCCFCVPIRKGVTIFGYVNLVLALLSLPLLVFLVVEQMTTETAVNDALYEESLEPSVHLSLTIVFVLVDVMMTVVLLVGAHKKKKILLQIYFHFGVVFQLVTLCTDLVYFDYQEYIENTVYFLFLCLNVYLLFLVYNTVRLLEESSEVQYVAYRDSRR